MGLQVGASISALDDRLLLWVNQFMTLWPVFDRSVAWLLTASILKLAPFVLVICWFWFDRSPAQSHRRHLLVEAVFTGFLALVVGRVLALTLPFRLRPLVRPDLGFVADLETGARTWSAFPSDHAVVAFALAASMLRLSPKVGAWMMLHAAVVICLPRFYFGLHHPSDLIGGALIGFGLVFVIAHLERRRAFTAAVIRVEQRHAGAFYSAGFLLLFELAEMFDSLRALTRGVFRAVGKLMA